MASVKITRALNLVNTLLLIQLTCAQNRVPDVRIQTFKPKGFKASIPDVPNLALFVFQGNLNRPLANGSVGSVTGEVVEPTNGRWVFEDPDLELKIGDVINYYVVVSINRTGYVRDNLSYTVTELEDRSGDGNAGVQPEDRPVDRPKPQATSQPPEQCLPTLTTVRGSVACAGQTIFEDNFDFFREDAWQIEQYIPVSHTDYPFVSYQKHMVTVSDGNLRIRAGLQQNEPGFSNDSIVFGSLNLYSGCTGLTESCYVQATGPDILPPVVTGRVVNKQFAFTYGTVYVRAKLPQGDWLYPEILLEPLLKKYGSLNHASGLLKIATARGNKMLYVGPSDYGNKILYGGVVIDSKCHDALLTNKPSSNGRYWGDDFHVYSVRWAPERITLSVDGEEWARIEPAASGLRGRLPPACRSSTPPGPPLKPSSSIAPFDDDFYLTFGVNAGGISEFRDGLYTEGGRPKPWRNQGRKARLNFWSEQYAWYPTWSHPELLIDYVKVVAL